MVPTKVTFSNLEHLVGIATFGTECAQCPAVALVEG
jgi:hypothetical protein